MHVEILCYSDDIEQDEKDKWLRAQVQYDLRGPKLSISVIRQHDRIHPWQSSNAPFK